LDGGPEREAYSSYGFLRNELYDPEQLMGHRNAETFIDPCDGEQYVKVIHYFIHHVSLSLLDAQGDIQLIPRRALFYLPCIHTGP